MSPELWGRRVVRTAWFYSLVCSLILSMVWPLAWVEAARLAPAAPAVAGDLDPDFGYNGRRTTDFGGLSIDVGRALLPLPGGGFILAGEIQRGENRDFALARFTAGGALDASFGINGLVWADLGSPGDFAYAAALQSDGKIVVAGSSDISPYGPNVALARFTTNGRLDPAFGNGGVVVATGLLGPEMGTRARAIVIQQDGRLVVGGDSHLVGFTPTGALDPTFGTQAVVTTTVNVYALAIQADQKLLAAGDALAPNTAFGVARFSSQGAIDGGFGTGGVASIVVDGPSFQRAYAIAVQSDTKIVLAGIADDWFGLARLNANGSPDAGFGSSGWVRTGFASWGGRNAAEARSVVVLPGNSLAVAGSAWSTSAADSAAFAVARYTSSGSLDASFGSSGRRVTDISEKNDGAYALALQTGGLLVAGGYAVNASSDFALARYTTAGALDVNFGSAGKTAANLDGSHDRAHALALLPGGKLVAAGNTFDGVSTLIGLSQYTSSGAPDLAFGSGGLARLRYGANTTPTRLAALLRQADGTLLAAGQGWSCSAYDCADLMVARLSDSGVPDINFGSGGYALVDAGEAEMAVDLAVQNGGKIVTAGITGSASYPRLVLARFDPTGVLDPGFGTGGLFRSSDITTTVMSPAALALQTDDKLIIAGWQEDGSGEDFLVARFLVDGALDPGFGSGGWLRLDFGGQDRARDIIVQPDGAIVVAGETRPAGGSADFALARLDPDGDLDPDFGSGGKVQVDFSGGADGANAVLRQLDGSLLVAGYATIGSGQDFALALLTEMGVPDASFARNGRLSFSLGAGDEQASSLGRQADGMILLAGWTWNNQNEDFAVARLVVAGGLPLYRYVFLPVIQR